MYKLEKAEYGLNLTLGGDIGTAVAMKLADELEQVLPAQKGEFSILVDARGVIPYERKTQEYVFKWMTLCRQNGCRRYAIIVTSPVLATQASRLAYEAGTGELERYINANEVENWEEIAIRWLVDGIEPERTAKPIKSEA
ncbi:MAG: hypothetical protein KAT85_02155 [candidate division Zixibacteria bacterium]|nr:hypothetical protein [candidate division Zixibacteria bacterium]